MRDGSDSVHSKFVDDVGNGVLNNLKQNCEISIDHITKIHSLNEAIQFCFPNLENPRENINSAILASTLLRVNEINKEVLQKLNGPLFPLNAKEKIDSEAHEQGITDAALSTYDPKNMPPHMLILKENCIVMLIRNLSPADGLSNGTKLIIRKIRNFLIECEDSNKKLHLIPRIQFNFKYKYTELNMTRLQFPLIVAYGMSINKSQGKTIDKEVLDLRTNCFSHGQLYVALGRVKNSNSIQILCNKESKKFQNIVIRSLIFNKSTNFNESLSPNFNFNEEPPKKKFKSNPIVSKDIIQNNQPLKIRENEVLDEIESNFEVSLAKIKSRSLNSLFGPSWIPDLNSCQIDNVLLIMGCCFDHYGFYLNLMNLSKTDTMIFEYVESFFKNMKDNQSLIQKRKDIIFSLIPNFSGRKGNISQWIDKLMIDTNLFKWKARCTLICKNPSCAFENFKIYEVDTFDKSLVNQLKNVTEQEIFSIFNPLRRCKNCKMEHESVHLTFDAHFPFILMLKVNKSSLINPPKTIMLQNIEYVFMGQIIFKPELEHFVSIVNFKDKNYYFDDLQPKLQKVPDHLSGGTNSVFYIKKNKNFIQVS
jgi:hypothetical protein